MAKQLFLFTCLSSLKQLYYFYHPKELATKYYSPEKRHFKNGKQNLVKLSLGNGCGSVGRGVASNFRGPRFESIFLSLLDYFIRTWADSLSKFNALSKSCHKFLQFSGFQVLNPFGWNQCDQKKIAICL